MSHAPGGRVKALYVCRPLRLCGCKERVWKETGRRRLSLGFQQRLQLLGFECLSPSGHLMRPETEPCQGQSGWGTQRTQVLILSFEILKSGVSRAILTHGLGPGYTVCGALVPAAGTKCWQGSSNIRSFSLIQGLSLSISLGFFEFAIKCHCKSRKIKMGND